MGPDCTSIEWVAGEAAVEGACGTMTRPAATSGDFADAEFNVVGCGPKSCCFKTDCQIPGASAAAVFAFDCGSIKLVASAAVAAAAVAFSM